MNFSTLAFFLAVAKGTPPIIKTFLEIRGGQFHPHFVDFVGGHQVFNSRWENSKWVPHWLAHLEEAIPERKFVKSDVEDIK